MPRLPDVSTPHHAALAALAGSWSGRSTTWFEPGAPGLEAPFNARAVMVMGGRFLELRYDSALDGKDFSGVLVVGFEGARKLHVATWMDEFHTGTAMMLLEGAPSGGTMPDMRGSWYAGDEKWGWRIAFAPEGKDRLTLRMWNVTPAGEDQLGLEIALERRSA